MGDIMKQRTSSIVTVLAVWLIIAVVAGICPDSLLSKAAGADEKLAKTWSDFIHYIRIGQTEAAVSFGKAIIESKAEAAEIYQLSQATEDAHKVLARGAAIEPLKNIIAKIRKKIESGYEAMRKDPAQIAQSISMLAGNIRAYETAAERLILSGEFALPQMVHKLMDPKIEPLLRERLITVLPRIGPQAVLPLSVAMQCDSPQLQEIFATALGRIQYPQAAARLKEFVQRKGILKLARKAGELALASCAGSDGAKDTKKTVAGMFYDTALKYYYHHQSLCPDERFSQANVWYWKDDAGLIYKPVPRQIFCDIYAMRMCRLALKHDPKFHQAISLWISAYINRETHLSQLAKGAKDPLIGKDHLPGRFYALAASAGYQQAVLARALKDQNTQLVMVIAEALAQTNGTENMVKSPGGSQPLVEAMAYPDKRVRFMAAEALALALPRKNFNGDKMVMVVLNEAIRQTGQKKAMVVIKDAATCNTFKDAVRAAGYQVLENPDPAKALTQANEAGGVDVFVTDRSPGPEQLLAILRRPGRFVATPVVAAVAMTNSRRELAGRDKRLVLIRSASDKKTIAAALNDAANLAIGKPMTPDQAQQWVVRAAKAVHLLAITNNGILDYKLAMPALLEAIKTKPPIQIAVADTFSAMNLPQAQRAIADLAIDEATDEKVRISAYNALIGSVRKFGNQLTDSQASKILSVVLSAKSAPLRQAAAQTNGVLDLTSEKIKQLILSTEAMD